MARESRSGLHTRWPLLLLALAVLCSGCKKQEDEKNSITGRVSTPEGDVGGVTVEMFAAQATSSTDAWAGSANHPEVGFLYELPTAWDYRRLSTQLLDSFTTGADGVFEFPDVADGSYVLSARKDGHGWSVPRGADVSGRSVDVGTLALAEVDTVPANVTTDTHWLSGHHYVALSTVNTVNIAAGVTLTIEPGAVVRLAEGVRMRVHGTLIAEGEPGRFILFTSDEPAPDAGDWQHIVFEENASVPRFRYCAFRYGEDAIRTRRPGGRIEYCYFGSFGATGATLGGTADTEMDSIIFRRNVANGVPLLLEVNNVPAARPLLIERNAISGSSKFGVSIQKDVQTGAVRCNWFHNCGDASTTTPTGALHLFDVRNLEVDHNEFKNSQYGVDLGSKVDSSVHIRNNYFYLLYGGLHVGLTPEIYGPSFPHFNFNCLKAITRYYLHMDACIINTKPVDATNNYWDGLSGSALQSKLYDREDDPTCPYITIGTILPACDRTQAGLCGL